MVIFELIPYVINRVFGIPIDDAATIVGITVVIPMAIAYVYITVESVVIEVKQKYTEVKIEISSCILKSAVVY
jgi:hypothetical protein